MQLTHLELPLPFPRSPLQVQTPQHPDKTVLGLKVTFPPSAAARPHTHHGAFFAVHVLTGSVLDKMNDDPMTIKIAGQIFYEAPGCRHRISTNASEIEEASIPATFVLETEKMDALIEKEGPMGLLLVDEEYREVIKEHMRKL